MPDLDVSARLERLALGLERRAADAVALTVDEFGYARRDAAFEVDSAISAIRLWSAEAAHGPRRRSIAPDGGVIAILVAGNAGAFSAADIASVVVDGVTVLAHLPSRAPELRSLLQALWDDAAPGVVHYDHSSGPEFVERALAAEAAGFYLWGTYETALHIQPRVLASGARFFFEGPGSDPVVVLDDVDVEAAASAIVDAKVRYSGQQCVSPEKVFCVRTRYDELCDALAELMANVSVADPADPDAVLTPVMSADGANRLRALHADAALKGARLVVGGDVQGRAVECTLILDAHPGMRCVTEELFGPVLAVVPVDDAAEAERLARAGMYGLSASVWGEGADSMAARMRGSDDLEELESLRFGRHGTVVVEGFSLSTPESLAQPFGGYGVSGWVADPTDTGIRLRQGPKSIRDQATMTVSEP